MNEAVFEILRKVTTATITTMLLKKGIRRCWMNGPKPLVPEGERVVGPAFTLRFVPVREDLATPESWDCHGGIPVRTLGDAIGIGWFLRDVDAIRTVGHGGSGNGQFAELLMVPERDSPSSWPPTPARPASRATRRSSAGRWSTTWAWPIATGAGTLRRGAPPRSLAPMRTTR